MPTVEESIEIDVPVSAAYDQWTQFEDFPRFMEGVEEVRRIDDTHLHWVAEIGGQREEWDAEITAQRPDELIAWRSTSGKGNTGAVTFHRIDDERSKIELRLEWESEGLTEKLGSMLGQDDRQVKNDLERFRDLLEERRGEIAQGRASAA